MTFTRNVVGRMVPLEINGRPVVPFQGIGKHRPTGNKIGPLIPTGADFTGSKLKQSIDEVLGCARLKDGMTVSFHHHLRNGDVLVNLVVERLAKLGVKGITLAPSALFPVHEPLVEYIKSGVVANIEGSMNGEVGRLCSTGGFSKTAILRSHGGRYRAIQDGDLHVDLAFIAAPSADSHGNANGVHGPSAFGSIGFALADSLYADQVVVVTDNLVPFPCHPWAIQGGNVDYVVQVDSLGDPEKIVSGTTKITTDPTRLKIARLAAELVQDTGLVDEPEFSFQAGAGGMSLAFVKYLGEFMREKGISASFARGGSTQLLVDLLNEGIVNYILDGQCFDMAGIRSLAENPRHIDTNPFTSYCYHTKGCFAPRVKVSVLGATEIDVNFNVNVNTHSDGWLLHGIGGFQDTTDAYMTVITAPLVRKIHPIVVKDVVTVTAPGEAIDALVTEYGIAINPRRHDILDRLKGSGLPLVTMEELYDKATELIGGARAPEPETTDRIVAAIEWRDGTVIDVVRQLVTENKE
jgi:citrate lyase subunit alpha / citrate CoA-transferase